ncbi:SRPBCC family protein [Gloeobacter kilaueensis]|uniref:Cyclase/dehydrase n=1 Tax=Gloeobacter kilaueensis (strain ATCC BAA-2537 / CCAP 1431/1 / ULC 316 / JS1) TaxID=1183438 RepID=U5QCI2_GLOK1|nr:SRPBCC family protein [Gloeobacter kilaueensis]AGY56548.1 cyclase/dehydrase [Gloeobacter kilaueensis JS1]
MAIGTSDTVAAHGNHRVSIEIAAPPELAYALWTQFEKFPRYFRHIEAVRVDPSNRLLQQWTGKFLGTSQTWNAEITNLTPNRIIAWRSVDGFENSGSLTFERNEATEPAGEGTTTLTLQIGYNPPLGFLGDVAEAVWYKQRFDEALEEDLSRFKDLCEALYARILARRGEGDSLDAAMQATLIDEGIPEQALPSKIERGEYEMNHIPYPGVITTTELGNRLAWGEVAFTILDVRPLEYYQQAHIQGASAAPLESLEERIQQITAPETSGWDRQIIVYSNRGDGLSALAAERLRAIGYSRVFDYVDGFEAWRSTHGPIETQTTGQIPSKGLPERSDYLERVTAAPSVNDNPIVGGSESEMSQEKVSPKFAGGVPGARIAEQPAKSEEQVLREAAMHERTSEELDPREDEAAGHRQQS